MGKLLVAGAVLLLSLYALYDTQRPGSRLRMTGITVPSFGTPTGGSIGAAAAGVAAKVGN